ncbi:energy-coupling factor transporter transmembrane protein EcfT [Agrococcus sp. HG114]|nr:energy-coupling factor transporter transmembrane protein EcfT [Agrococcus sp. HG114]
MAPEAPAAAGSRLARLHPLTQLGIVGLLALAALLFEWPVGVAVAVVSFVLAAAAGRAAAFFRVWWKTILVLCLIILVLQTFFIPGETVVAELGPLRATQEGLDKGIGFAGRVAGIGSAVLLLTVILDVHRLVLALEQRGVNPRVTYVILATVNIIPEMRKRMTVIMDAQRSRGIETDADVWVRARAFIPTIGPLILTSIVSVEEKALTLESRGFSIRGPRTSLESLDDPAGERALRKALIVIAVLVVVGGVLQWVL